MSTGSTPPVNEAVAAAPGDDGRGGVARRLPTVLVVVATVLALVSTLTTWVRVQALDTDEWTDLSSELLDEPEIREALAVHLVDVLYRQLDVSGELAELLPDDLSGLAPTITGALRAPATEAVERLLASDRFGDLWASVNRTAHETLVAILRDETRAGISTADGTVTLDLGPLVRNVGESLGLSDSLLDRLPPDAGQITVFESDELSTAQDTVRVLDFLSWFMFLAVVVLYAAAVYLARGRRREVLRVVGLSLLAVGVTVLLARIVAVRTAIDAIVEDPSREPVAQTTAFVFTGLLRQMGWSGVVFGLLITAFAWLLGDGRIAVGTRRTLSPFLNAPGAAVAGGTVVAILVLLWWSPGRAFDRVVTASTLVVLVVAAVIALRTNTRREFRDVTLRDVTARFAPGSRTPPERSQPGDG